MCRWLSTCRLKYKSPAIAFVQRQLLILLEEMMMLPFKSLIALITLQIFIYGLDGMLFDN